MNLHHPSGFAPAGIPVNFHSTCSTTFADLLLSESSWAGGINLRDQSPSVNVDRWKQEKLNTHQEEFLSTFCFFPPRKTFPDCSTRNSDVFAR